MAEVLQFGEAEPGQDYRDRPAAFGVLERDGKIALARIQREGEAAYFDLPGGALDPGESEAEALVREFGEETGLKVRAGPLLARASQFMLKTDGQRVNNRSALFVAEWEGEDAALKIEADHQLVWLEPLEALARLRHGSHAWAVARWLRSKSR
jgi:8-oxo-dGTP diphosphatase